MKRTKKQCDKCNREISLSNFSKHYNSCKGIIEKNKINEKYKQENGLYKCPYCEKEYLRMGILTHIMRKHTNPEKWKNTGWSHHSKSWNKGLTKETDERVKQNGKSYSDNIKNGKTKPSFKGKHHTDKTIEKLSIYFSKNNKGGKCKWYKTETSLGIEFNVQGTWELKFTKVLNFIDENWIKIGVGDKDHSFEWKDEHNIIHYYSPDFWSPKLNKYFEVKGYLRERDEDFIRHDCKDRISKLEALLEASSKEKDELRAIVLNLSTEVAKLQTEVAFLQTQSKKASL